MKKYEKLKKVRKVIANEESPLWGDDVRRMTQ
jgi:hypothetical protein